MSLMARLGGRNRRKIPIELFEDGSSVDLGGSGGATVGADVSVSPITHNAEIVPTDPTKGTIVVAAFTNNSGAPILAQLFSFDLNVSVDQTLAGSGAHCTLMCAFAPGESYAVNKPADVTVVIWERSIG